MQARSLELVNLSKRFGDFVALEDASLKVRAGSFHALLGENGAGKSTLVKCVIGYQAPSSGDVLVDNREARFDNPRQAHRAGIGMVYQRFTLAENMSVAENMVLTRDPMPKLVRWRDELRELTRFMDSMPFRVPLDVKVHDLAAGEKQKLEILRQLYLGRRLLFLDEPTSVLTPSEADEVLGLLHKLTRAGELSVLIITHKFREVSAFADHITILRRGRVVGDSPLADTSIAEMSRLMVGEQSVRKPAPRTERPDAPVRLEVKDLHVSDDSGIAAVRGLGLRVRSGEILGIAGVSGNGQRELVEAIAGQRRYQSGEIRVAGHPFVPTRRNLDDLRMRVIPEVPLDNACVPRMSVRENLALRAYDKPPIKRGFFMSKRRLEAHVDPLIARFSIKAPSPAAPIAALSGGNIQRAVLARELGEPCSVLIAVNPCFGLDFAAAGEIRAQIVDARNQGAAVLFISEDLDELLQLSDRLSVISDGVLVSEHDPRTVDLSVIGAEMAGHHSPAA
jgi:general nucleoside transport system ATP-binding protein